MTYSTDERHAATLQLLQEVVDYLNRLPAVPVTKELCRKVEAHLEDPLHRLTLEGGRYAGQVYEGSSYTAAGIPLIHSRVVFPTEVVVWAEKPSQADARRRHAESLVKQLFEGGIRFELRRLPDGVPYPRYRPSADDEAS